MTGVLPPTVTAADAADCRVMFTRRCPISGCMDLPCARFESDDQTRWALDQQLWAARDPKRLPGVIAGVTAE